MHVSSTLYTLIHTWTFTLNANRKYWLAAWLSLELACYITQGIQIRIDISCSISLKLVYLAYGTLPKDVHQGVHSTLCKPQTGTELSIHQQENGYKTEVYLQKWEPMTSCSKQLKPTSNQVRQNLTPPPPQPSLMQNKTAESLQRPTGPSLIPGAPLCQYPQLGCPGSLLSSPTAPCCCSCTPSLLLPWAFPLQSLCPEGSSPRHTRLPSLTAFSRRPFLTTLFKL